MPRKPVPCAGGCGKSLNSGRGSLPAGIRTCQPCRHEGRGPKREPQRRTRDCAVCGSRFHPKDHSGREQLTCSLSCGQALRHVRNPRPPRTWGCEVCGEAYRRSYSGQRTCGRTCGVALQARNRPLKPAPPPQSPCVCAQCGETFDASRQRYCSAACAAEAKRAYDRAYNARRAKAHPPGKCRQCGRAIASGVKCADCIATSRLERKRRERRRRRVLKRGAATEPYTLAEIATRDRNICQLCRKRVAMTQKVPHPKAPTIDHVVPLADHGDDVRANVQLAHFECNWMKRDGGTQQLALIG